MVERPLNNLIFVETRIIFAGTVNAVDHGVQMEMLANRNALILRLATCDRQVVSVSTQFGQLFWNTVINGIVQTAWNLLTRIIRIIEHRFLRIIPTVDGNALIE